MIMMGGWKAMQSGSYSRIKSHFYLKILITLFPRNNNLFAIIRNKEAVLSMIKMENRVVFHKILDRILTDRSEMVIRA